MSRINCPHSCAVPLPVKGGALSEPESGQVTLLLCKDLPCDPAG